MTQDKLAKIRQTLGFDQPNPSAEQKEDYSQQFPERIIATGDDVPLDSELNQDFESYFTQHTFASHPLSKLALVSFASAVVVVIFVIFYSLMQSSSPSSPQLHGSQAKEKSELFGAQDRQEQREMDQLKARLALSQQKASTQPRPKPEPVKKPEPVAEKKVTLPPSPPVTPLPPTQPIVPSQPVVQPIPPPQAVVKPLPEDSLQRWHELAKIGSYQSKGSATELPLVQPQPSSPNSLLAESNLGKNNGLSLASQKVVARLEGGIAVPVGNREQLSVALVLLEPLVDTNEHEIVPVGAVIIADVSLRGGVVQFTPQTLSFESEQDYYEIPLAPASVMITGEQGPIIARQETVGQDGGGLSVTQMGQLVTAAGGLVGLEGARDLALIFNALGGGNSRPSPLNQGIQIYSVREGTEVMIRIPRNLPLNISPDRNQEQK